MNYCYTGYTEVMSGEAEFSTFLRDRQVNAQTWKKSSVAPRMIKLIHPNRSQSSSALGDPYDIIAQVDINLDSDVDADANRFWTDSHSAVCLDVKEWLLSNLGIDDDDDQIIVKINNDLPADITCNSLWTKGDKRPDVAVYTSPEEHLLLQVKVQSGHVRDTTIHALVVSLIDQNRFERNYNSDAIKMTSGLYFPVDPGFIERVDCMWDDRRMRYLINCHELVERDATRAAMDIIQARRRAQQYFTGERNNFTIPMTSQYLQSKFVCNSALG